MFCYQSILNPKQKNPSININRLLGKMKKTTLLYIWFTLELRKYL